MPLIIDKRKPHSEWDYRCINSMSVRTIEWEIHTPPYGHLSERGEFVCVLHSTLLEGWLKAGVVIIHQTSNRPQGHWSVKWFAALLLNASKQSRTLIFLVLKFAIKMVLLQKR